MKNLLTILLALVFRPAQQFANEAATTAKAVSLYFVNQFTADADNWVQLSPFGDFANVDKNGKRVIQRVDQAACQEICNNFNGPLRKVMQPLGMPFYIGHPDHPRFKGQAGHTDNGAKGRGKAMVVRHDASCAKCADFANTGQPCGDHGLFVQMKWNTSGEQIIANEEFHGHSVNWSAVPAGREGTLQIFKPVSVKSTGFTNEPAIPVAPATLANELAAEELANGDGEIVPPKLKVAAGFTADQDVTLEQCIDALKKATIANEKPPLFVVTAEGGVVTIDLVNEGDGIDLPALAERVNSDLATLRTGKEEIETQLANHRSAAAGVVVDGLVKSGHIPLVNREAKVTELANAADFAAAAIALATVTPVIKTKSKTGDLGHRNPVMIANTRERTAKFEDLMAKRAQEFPNEDYPARYNAVGNSPEGQQLLAQMQRPGEAQD